MEPREIAGHIRRGKIESMMRPERVKMNGLLWQCLLRHGAAAGVSFRAPGPGNVWVEGLDVRSGHTLRDECWYAVRRALRQLQRVEPFDGPWSPFTEPYVMRSAAALQRSGEAQAYREHP